MKPSKTTRELRIGEIAVAEVDEILAERFRATSRLRSEAQAILAGCFEADRKTWEDVVKEYNLPRNREYRFLHSTKEIAVSGYLP
ncbi:MAG: hypothetical protein ABIJ57_09065 [Pseudomonadota bacterium]